VHNTASANGASNVVSLSLIHYASIKPTAITDGLLSVVNGQLYDASIIAAKESAIIRPQKGPYQTNKLFIAAAANNTAKNGILKLLFKPNLYYTNTGLNVSNIQVDFGNGSGFVNASFNTAVSGAYSSTGNKQLIYKITFSDGSIAQCYNTINVPYLPSSNNASRYAGAPVDANGADIPDVVINSVTNAHAGVDLFIRRSTANPGSNTNPQFRKPLIVVEGLDLSSGTTLLGNGYNYNDFRDEIMDGFKTSFISGTNPLQPFDQYLDDVAGYDLIFVNLHDGIGDILKNAIALREVINYVNARKLPNAEQNVIMGISMGGLISRYCLAQMVKAGGTGINETQTRLLITHDSPHRGANIPLALQHLLQGLRKQSVKAFLGIYNKRLDEVYPKLKDVNTIINSPAATQQLLARVIDDNGTLAYNTFLDGDYRTIVNFAGTGFTQPYRFVTTTNGSQCGVPLAAPYSQLASIDADGWAYIFGIPLWTQGRTYLDMHRLPDIGQTSRILDFNLKLKVKFLVFNLLKISMQIQQNAPGNLLPLDGLAGGTRNLGGATLSSNLSIIPNASGSANWLIFGYDYGAPYIAPTFSFITTPSALDVVNVNAVNIPYSVPFTGLNGSRAANFIAQERITLPPPTGTVDNVNHTDFYARTCTWLYNEMESLTQPITCNDFCEPSFASSIITGPRIVCNTAVYTISTIPTGYTATWSLPAGSGSTLVLSPNASGTQCTVTNLNYHGANVNLTVTFSRPNCTSTGTVTKPISTDQDYLNPPSFGYSFIQDACTYYGVSHPSVSGVVFPNALVFIHQGCNVSVRIGDLNSIGKTINFESAGLPPSYWNYDGEYLQFSMPLGSGGVPAVFKISGDGACFERRLLFYVISGNGRTSFVANPNPVSDMLNIKVIEDTEQIKSATRAPKNYLINISELNTLQPINQISLSNVSGDFQINMAGIKTGYYAVEINDGANKQVLKIFKL
jgi:hypothetical protein